MATNLGGYDDTSGWYPDDSTNNQFGDDVDLTMGRGSYGPGGFRANPKLVGPAAGRTPGLSLGTAPGGPASDIPNYTSPGQQNLRPGMSPTVRPPGPGSYTDADLINPKSGGGWGVPLTMAGAGASIAAIPALSGVNNAADMPAAIAQDDRDRAQLYGWKDSILNWLHGSGRAPNGPVQPGNQTGVPGVGPGPTIPNPAQAAPPPGILSPGGMPFPQQNQGDPRIGEGVGQGPINPNPLQQGPQQGMPWAGNNNGVPLNAPGPPPRPANLGGGGRGRSPVRTPVSAGPAAIAQQPNMGSYDPNGRFIGIPRVNAPAGQSGGRGGGGGPWQTALNLSSLFGGGQPAAPATTARPDQAQRVPLDQTPLPPRRPMVNSPVYPDPTIAAGGPGHGARTSAPPPTYADPTIAAGGPGRGARSRTADLPFRNWGILGGS